ncbi:MAG: hypothetical protein HFG74_02575 [Hungatella sp.]|nr:hypothetical protein [Hungatella sp.]
MGFLKHLWGILFAAALILIVGGVVWYLMFYGAQRDYTGGMLVQISDMMRGAV